jgi:hypothetical protein
MHLFSGHSLVVKRYPSKLDMRVRFPLPAPFFPSPTPMKKHIIFALALASATFASAAPKTDCKAVSGPLKKAVVGKSLKRVLAMIDKEVKASPNCACELVKSAIKGYKPRPHTVAAMVDTAIMAAPERMDEILQCALTAAPDAYEEIMDVAGSFGSSFNPLNFPGLNGQGPNGQYIFNTDTPIFINPPQVTGTDPQTR